MLDAMAISVNVAPVTLMHESFAPWLGLQLAQRGLPPRTLKLEMTEHAVIALGPQMVAQQQHTPLIIKWYKVVIVELTVT